MFRRPGCCFTMDQDLQLSPLHLFDSQPTSPRLDKPKFRVETENKVYIGNRLMNFKRQGIKRIDILPLLLDTNPRTLLSRKPYIMSTGPTAGKNEWREGHRRGDPSGETESLLLKGTRVPENYVLLEDGHTDRKGVPTPKELPP